MFNVGGVLTFIGIDITKCYVPKMLKHRTNKYMLLVTSCYKVICVDISCLGINVTITVSSLLLL